MMKNLLYPLSAVVFVLVSLAVSFTLFTIPRLYVLQKIGALLTLAHLILQFDLIRLKGSNKRFIFLTGTYILFLIVSYYNSFFINAADVHLFGYILFVYVLFSVVYKRGEFGASYEKITLASVVSTLVINILHALYPTNFGHTFFTKESRFVLVAGSVVIMIFIVFYSLKKAQETRSQIEHQEKSIDWYGTLMNLIAHNLRSPLTSVMSNLEILGLKNPELNTSAELNRALNAVDTSKGIIERLLKATFLDREVLDYSVVNTVKKSYPEVKISGQLNKPFTYEENISILLAIEVFVDNALKFTSSEVNLSFENEKIRIRDFGPGINESKLNDFGNFDRNSVGTLHGIGIPFAVRVLRTIGYKVHAANVEPGLEVTICPIK